MKVVYKKSIIEQLKDAFAEAEAQNKKIEKIILTKEEWYDLGEEIDDPRWKYHHCYLGNPATIGDIVVECVE